MLYLEGKLGHAGQWGSWRGHGQKKGWCRARRGARLLVCVWQGTAKSCDRVIWFYSWALNNRSVNCAGLVIREVFLSKYSQPFVPAGFASADSANHRLKAVFSIRGWELQMRKADSMRCSVTFNKRDSSILGFRYPQGVLGPVLCGYWQPTVFAFWNSCYEGRWREGWRKESQEVRWETLANFSLEARIRGLSGKISSPKRLSFPYPWLRTFRTAPVKVGRIVLHSSWRMAKAWKSCSPLESAPSKGIIRCK